MSHLRAEVRNPAATHGHLTAAVFGSPRRGFEFTDLAPPAGFVPLDMALWDFGPDGDDEGHLVAYATQVCFFTFA